jgi:hypothetical protein
MLEVGVQARTSIGPSSLVPPASGLFLTFGASLWGFDKGVLSLIAAGGPFSSSEKVLSTGERWSPRPAISCDLRALWDLPALVDGHEARLAPVVGPQLGFIMGDGGEWTAPPCKGRWRDDACQGALFSTRSEYHSFTAHAVAGLIGTWSRFTVTVLATVGVQATNNFVDFDGVNTPAARVLYRRIVDEHTYSGWALSTGLQLAVGYGFVMQAGEVEP